MLRLPRSLIALLPGAALSLAFTAASASAQLVRSWWQDVDTGPFIADTFRYVKDGPVIALKGLAIKVGPQREATAVFDTELLAWRTAFDGAIALEGTNWSGSHGGSSFVPPGTATMFFRSSTGLGWAVNNNWNDPRE